MGLRKRERRVGKRKRVEGNGRYGPVKISFKRL